MFRVSSQSHSAYRRAQVNMPSAEVSPDYVKGWVANILKTDEPLGSLLHIYFHFLNSPLKEQRSFLAHRTGKKESKQAAG